MKKESKSLKQGGGDCLLKTQDFAKFLYDVLSLTPARCCKTKNN